MGNKAYFMIEMGRKCCDEDCYLDAVRELEAMPEVEAVKPVSGVCDLLVKVDAPTRVIFIANKIRAKKWVKGFRILNIELAQGAEVPRPAEEELLDIPQ